MHDLTCYLNQPADSNSVQIQIAIWCNNDLISYGNSVWQPDDFIEAWIVFIFNTKFKHNVSDYVVVHYRTSCDHPTKRRRRWDIPKLVEIRRKATSFLLRRVGVCRRRTNWRQFDTSYWRPTYVKRLTIDSTFNQYGDI